MIAHNAPCGGRILFETQSEALARLSSRGERPPPPNEHGVPREFRQLYCTVCGTYWDRKREMWTEAHTEEEG
jgi:hypothetical protein